MVCVDIVLLRDFDLSVEIQPYALGGGRIELHAHVSLNRYLVEALDMNTLEMIELALGNFS